MAADVEDEVPEGLFKDVTFYIVGEITENVIEKLTRGGGKRDTYLSEMVSHVIADDVDHHEYQEARELFELPCVMSEWVTLSVQCKKMLDKEWFDPEGMLFSGVVACSSQVDQDDWLSLWMMIVTNGGRCQGSLTSRCTHLITSAMEGPKYVAAMQHKDSVKVVTPDWVTDCIDKGSKPDEELYHPRLVVYPKPESPPKEKSPTPSPVPEMETNQEVSRLAVPPPLERRLSHEENRGGGSRPTTPSACAKEALARMVNHRMLDVPPPRIPGPGQQKLRNITNSMDILKQQVQQRQNKAQLGTQEQHMQLPVRPPPPSYFVPPGGIPLPHQQQQQPLPPQPMPTYWGHDLTENIPTDMCLLGCIFYITDYQKIVGMEQIAVWKQVIEQHGGQVDPSYSNRTTHVLCAHRTSEVFLLALRDQRRVVTAFWLNDVILKKKLLPPWQALHLPLMYGEDNNKPCSNQIICITNFEDDERTRVKQMISSVGAKYTGYMTRANSALVCKKGGGTKYLKAKEWEIPVVNVPWLSDLILGHMEALKMPIPQHYLTVHHEDHFQMDLAKSPQLMMAWRTPLKVAKEIWKKFAHMIKPKQFPLSGQENVPLIQPPDPAIAAIAAKKMKMECEATVDLSAPGPRVLFTGFPKGVSRKLQAMVSQLGGHPTENAQMCTHLVATSFSRTMKFFVAINVCHFVVTKQWVEDSYQQNQFANEGGYILHDPMGEEEMKCSLAQSINRARAQPLFGGMTFYVTPSVQPPISDLQKVIESAGGTLSRKRRLAAKTISSLVDDLGNPTYIVITCADDIHLCEDLINKNIRVYTAEFVLSGVMRQERSYNQYQIDVQR